MGSNICNDVYIGDYIEGVGKDNGYKKGIILSCVYMYFLFNEGFVYIPPVYYFLNDFSLFNLILLNGSK